MPQAVYLLLFVCRSSSNPLFLITSLFQNDVSREHRREIKRSKHMTPERLLLVLFLCRSRHQFSCLWHITLLEPCRLVQPLIVPMQMTGEFDSLPHQRNKKRYFLNTLNFMVFFFLKLSGLFICYFPKSLNELFSLKLRNLAKFGNTEDLSQ